MALDNTEVEEALKGNDYAEALHYNIYESQNLGIHGVPYSVVDRKYNFSGAQPVQAFINALTQSFTAWKKEQSTTTFISLNKNNGAICDENGCEI